MPRRFRGPPRWAEVLFIVVKLSLRKNDVSLVIGGAIGLSLTQAPWEPLAWFGTALVLFCSLSAGPTLQRIGLPGWALRFAPPALVCCVALWLMRDLVFDGVPLSRDHPVHFYKTWILAHDLIPTGRLWGWTDRWYAGLPVNELYPLLPYLWSSGAHFLSFGLIDLEHSYGLGQAGLWTLLALVTYAWGNRLGGPLAGVAAAIFVLFDPGACRGGGREGGWTYLFQFGVWPQAFAVTLALAGGLAASKVVNGGGRRWIAAAAALGAVSLLAHPMGAIPLFGIYLALWFGSILEQGESEHRSSSWRVFISLFVAVLLAAFWYALFIGNRSYVRASASTWRDLDDLGRSLLRGELFLEGWAIPAVLALCGAYVLARRRKAVDIAILGLTLISVTLASPHLWGTLFGGNLPGLFGSIQYDRFVIHAKPLFFAMSGVGLATFLGAAASTTSDHHLQTWRRHVVVALICLFLAPLALWAARGATTFMPEVGQIPTIADLPEGEDLTRLGRWLKQRNDESEGALRVALRHEPGNQRVMEELFVVAANAGVSIHHLSGTPADPFTFRSYDSSPEELRALCVRFVVGWGNQDRDDLREVERFGPWAVQEVIEPGTSRVTLRGPGQARTLTFEDELVRVELEGVADDSFLIVHRSPHRRWRATLDGEPIELHPQRRGSRAVFMRTSRLRDGLLELRYSSTVGDVIGGGLTLLGLLLLALLLAPSRWLPTPLERLAEPRRYRPLDRRVQVVLTVMAVALVLLGASLFALKIQRVGPRNLVDEVSAAEFEATITPPCRTIGICRVSEVPPVVVLRPRRGQVGPCIRLTAPTMGRYKLIFPPGRAGEEVRGSWYWTSGPRNTIEIRPSPLSSTAPQVVLGIGGIEHSLPRGRRGQWRDFSHDVPEGPQELSLELISDSAGRVDACFRVEVR